MKNIILTWQVYWIDCFIFMHWLLQVTVVQRVYSSLYSAFLVGNEFTCFGKACKTKTKLKTFTTKIFKEFFSKLLSFLKCARLRIEFFSQDLIFYWIPSQSLYASKLIFSNWNLWFTHLFAPGKNQMEKHYF